MALRKCAFIVIMVKNDAKLHICGLSAFFHQEMGLDVWLSLLVFPLLRDK
jgi:hypothetical protein